MNEQEYTHQIVIIQAALTKNGKPMWRCTTSDGEKVMVFASSSDPNRDQRPVWKQAGYDLDELTDGKRQEWYQFPIKVAMVEQDGWWKVIAVEPRKAGALPDPRFAPDRIVCRNYAREWAGLVLGQNAVFWDTETTGVERDDEIISIGWVQDGVEAQQLIKPLKMDRVALHSDVHGFTPEALEGEPSFFQVYPIIKFALADECWAIYNAAFDTRMLYNDCTRSGRVPICSKGVHDVMEIFSNWYGEWDDERYQWKSKTLSFACEQLGIALGDDAHDAMADAFATREVCRKIAEGK